MALPGLLDCAECATRTKRFVNPIRFLCCNCVSWFGVMVERECAPEYATNCRTPTSRPLRATAAGGASSGPHSIRFQFRISQSSASFQFRFFIALVDARTRTRAFLDFAFGNFRQSMQCRNYTPRRSAPPPPRFIAVRRAAASRRIVDLHHGIGSARGKCGKHANRESERRRSPARPTLASIEHRAQSTA